MNIAAAAAAAAAADDDDDDNDDDNDNNTVDENECAAEDLCQNGQCVNVDGSFKCLCETGYTLSASGKQCQGTKRLHGFIYSTL